MNRAQRRAAAHLKRGPAAQSHADRFAGLWLLDNARPNAPGERAGAHVKTRVFFDRLCDGSASLDDFDHVGMVINMCKIRAIEIDATLADMLERAQDAMTECQARYRRLGRFGFTGPELTHMRDAIDACEAIIDASSPLQMRSARRIAIDAVLGEKGAWRRIEAQFDRPGVAA